ncbi:MAG TPA: hypothetical protein VI078_07130 [bacterium]
MSAGAWAPAASAWLALPRPVPRRWLVFALLALALLARQPRDLLHPQFNAEEGSIIFQQAYNQGPWRSLFVPASGYLHLTLRLAGALALLVPLELAPLVFKVLAVGVQMVPVAYLLADGVPGFAVAPAFRVAGAAAVLAGPNSQEVYLNLNNSQWFLTLAGCLILLAGPRPGKWRRALDTGVILLFATTGPFVIACAPLALWSLWRCRARGVRTWTPLIALAGAAVQLALLATGPRATSATAGFGIPTVAEIVRILGLDGAANAFFGLNFVAARHSGFPAGAVLAAAAAVPALGLAAVALRNLALLVLLGLATVAAAVPFLFPLNDPRHWLSPAFGPRYFFFTMLFVVCTLLAMAERGGTWRALAVPGLAAVLLLGVRGDYRIPPAMDTHWHDQVAAFRSLPPGTDFFIPVYPQVSAWGMTLRRTSQPAAADPLAGHKASGAPLRAAVEFVGTTLPPDSTSPDQKVIVRGYAADAGSRSAAGVFLNIDGRLFPAVTGMTPEATQADPSLAGAGFARYVPRDALGAGAHELQVLALDHAGTSLLAPGPTRRFTLP